VIHIIGGGTFSHVRNHLALAAPAFGGTARKLAALFPEPSFVHLTKMAIMADVGERNAPVTNKDVAALIDRLVADPSTRVIIMSAALCDYTGKVVEERHGEETFTASGKYAQRLKTSEGHQMMGLFPADKVIGRIRKERKDIFAVGFKTTTGATSDEQYRAGLELLKKNSLNLVLANDTVTRNNMIIAPEETRYHETKDREEALRGLVEMVMARKDNTFTRSTVVEGDLYHFYMDERIPDSLKKVVDHCIDRGAYKPVNGATAGHFATRLNDKSCLTSVRKSNYNTKTKLALVQVDYEGLDRVTAHGAKPSVGGQSQRIIFDSYPEIDCIVHAHVPLKENARDTIPVAPQWQNECGSHQCGLNTATNLAQFGNLKAVMLEGHGPNIVFPRDTDPAEVIDFIEANFDLEAKTGGLVAA
jgi:hypothetical protein